MKNLSYILAVVAISSLSLYSCGNDDKDDTAVAGKGGTTTLKVYPQHHLIAKNISYCTVYIKYNTLDIPGNGIYDDSAVCKKEDSVLVATFDGLKNGNYYLFGRGYDSSISAGIKGGLPATITEQGKTITTPLPVGEE